jgi:hypothetical protein
VSSNFALQHQTRRRGVYRGGWNGWRVGQLLRRVWWIALEFVEPQRVLASSGLYLFRTMTVAPLLGLRAEIIVDLDQRY